MMYHHSIGIALAVSVLIAGTGPLAVAADFSDQVIRILNGDTLEVLHN